MKHHFLRICLALLGSVMVSASASAQSGDSYELGQKISGKIGFGQDGVFGSTKREVPLPPGEWTVLYGESNKSVVQMGRVFLVKQDAGRISELLIVMVNTARGSSVTFPDLCGRQDIAYKNKYDSGTWDQRCLEVLYAVGLLTEKPGSGNKMKDATVSLGLSAEPTMMWMSYAQIDKKGNILRWEYLVDPSKYEIDTAPSNYQDSPWHNSKLAKDARRASFVKQFIAYSEVLSEHLQLAFQFKPLSPNPIPAFSFKE